jgi:hypothetical protein|tara:strand:+ start:334 stop:633 length:300 start_codon:yes stop_codon:yes gene_type:complete
MSSQTSEQNYRMPSNTCLQHAWKLAIVEDKEVKSDYWTSSLDKEIIIGVKSNQEKLLVKSEDEYTSPISKIYKVETEYIIVTENSIYLVSGDIDSQRIS